MDNRMSKMQIFSGSTLKIIAIITMLIDHIGACLTYYATPYFNSGVAHFEHAQTCYVIMRQIGRTAFPLFCFLLIEGFVHTKNSFIYLARLMIFAIISEIPFDLAVESKVISWSNQNVFFTLALGLGMMMILETIRKGGIGKENVMTFQFYEKLIWIGVIFLFVLLAELIQCDYGGAGIILIGILYSLRESRILASVMGYMFFLWEPFCFPAFILIPFYNGKRGKQIKYLFYIFYPVHLLLLVWIRYVIFHDVGIKS